MRAVKKAIEERKLKDQKDAEIGDLKGTQLSFTNKKERQSNAIDNNVQYHRYLESLIEGSNEFVEVKDIISRFDTLSATNQELIDRARSAQEKTENDRIQFLATTEVLIF